MAGQFYRTRFGEHAREKQTDAESRSHYASLEARDASPDLFGPRETEFIATRDSFYMATVTSKRWPYVQHRGGAPGSMHVLASNLLCYGEVTGNQQFISIANLATNDRVALFFMDYAKRRRLKVIGHARPVESDAVPELFTEMGEATKNVIVIRVIGFDWNCPQHITQRFTSAEAETHHDDLGRENTLLRTRIAHLGEQKR